MKRIAFVDHKLENYHANVFADLLAGPLRDRGFELTACRAADAAEGQVWAEKHKVPYAGTHDDLNRLADFFMVLAPSNPEVHLAMVQALAPFKKPVWVDKTFAPDLATAKAIYAAADAAGIQVETASALRYTPVQKRLSELGRGTLRHMVAWGGGGHYDEYVVHPTELTVSCLGAGATAVMCRGEGEQRQLAVEFTGGRTAVINVYCKTKTAFAASLTTETATEYVSAETPQLFEHALAAVLNFFAAGAPTFPREETLAVFKIIEGARDPRAARQFVPLPS